MTRGRYVCDTLKAVRKRIADANDIRYEPRECTHEGECQGTCPACEAEVRYLESELDKRSRLGKAVAVAGVAAGMMAGLSGCGLFHVFNPPLAGIPADPQSRVEQPVAAPADSTKVSAIDEPLMGDVLAPEPEKEDGDKTTPTNKAHTTPEK